MFTDILTSFMTFKPTVSRSRVSAFLHYIQQAWIEDMASRASSSEDEYDALPDQFDDVDWDSVNITGLESLPPALPPQTFSSRSTDRSSSQSRIIPPTRTYTLTDLKASAGGGKESDQKGGVCVASAREDSEVNGDMDMGRGCEPGRCTTPSSSYSFDPIDEEFLKEVDAVEARMGSSFRREEVEDDVLVSGMSTSHLTGLFVDACNSVGRSWT